jgi:amino acid adenylation domain-containing protein
MMEVLEILTVCREKGIRLVLDDSGMNLRLQGNIRSLTADEKRRVIRHKAAIITLLDRAGDGDPIVPVAQAPDYPLSSAQQRIWVLCQFQGAESAYHVSITRNLEGRVDPCKLQAAFHRLTERHEILRTVIVENGIGEPRQVIRDRGELNFILGCTDLRGESSNEERVGRLVSEARRRPFDLGTGPLLRADLYRLTADRWVFALVIHHVISDGWSTDILVRDLMHFYGMLHSGAKAILPTLGFQYKDFACWQQRRLATGMPEGHRAYWLAQLNGELPVLELAGDHIRPPIKMYNGGVMTRVFAAKTGEGLKELVGRQGRTLFMGLTALVRALLYRYTGQEDLIIGTPVAGRLEAGLENQVGLYMNTLPLRIATKGTASYTELLEHTGLVILEASSHQDYPFDMLVNELGLQRDLSRNALFDVLVALQQEAISHDREQPEPDEIRIAAFHGREGRTSKFDLSFIFMEQQEGLGVELTYNSDIFDADTIDRMGSHLEGLLAAMLERPAAPLSELEYLDPREARHLLVDLNFHAASTYPGNVTITGLLEQQVRRSPDAIALVCGPLRLTYKEMDERANRLANCLVDRYSLRKDSLVGVMLDRSVDMIVAILATLKAGAAYVPLDPEHPTERIDYMLKDSGAALVLTSGRYRSRVASGAAILVVEGEIPDGDYSGVSPQLPSEPDALAYVIYTSGSTGRPKGVMISHGAVVDYFYGILAATNIGACRHFGMLSTIAADLGNTVLYPALLTGGTLHIYTADALIDADRLSADQLDCIKIVPSHWRSVQGAGGAYLPGKCLIFGGEQLTPDLLAKMASPDRTCEIYNHYGPTETTIGKLICRIEPERAKGGISLGSPFCSSTIYILDGNRRLTPMGVAGEICIGGAGLARGYLNQPKLTAEKFVSDPYREGERIYLTGDLGRRLADGTIEFMGRKDQQVKIRGYRIEPGEIEAILCQHEDINMAVVTVITAGGEKELVAYLVASRESDIRDLRDFLGARLPAYMVPAHFVRLDKMPLTLNGKIDRRALPHPSAGELPAHTRYVAPRNEIERELVATWQDLLGKERIGIRDNFFDLGGHSLKAMQLISRINGSFAVRLNIQSLFKEPVIENISEQVVFILSQRRLKENKQNLKPLEI